jgi:hypothetical protein
MIRRSRFWWRSSLAIALAVVAVVSGWSWWVQPKTTQLGFARLPGGARSSVVLSNQNAGEPRNQPCAAWRMHLRIDSALTPPGPAWLMFEGGRPGDGYELHWQPNRMALMLVRSGGPLVLGATTLDHFPAQVVLVRHGFHLEVWADDQPVLTILDPQTTSAATAWGFQAAGPMEGSTISLHDDRRHLPESTMRALAGDAATLRLVLTDRAQADHALFVTRHALMLDADKAPIDKATAIRNATAAINAYASTQPGLAELRHWLAWGETHLALTRQDLDAATRAGQTLKNLEGLATSLPVEESAGLAMELLDRLVKACSRTPYRAPEDVISWRAAWFSLLADCAGIALAHGSPALPDDWRWQLRLLIHGAESLRGLPPKPTPAEAPDWVVCRWRAFAGGNPGGTAFTSPIPVAVEERNPIRPALERLIQLAAFEPGGIAAVSMRAAILDALETPAAPNAGPEAIERQRQAIRDRALEAVRAPSAPTREAALAQAILALCGIGDFDEALRALDPDPRHRMPNGDGTQPLARHDPLAYALYRLLRHRRQGPQRSHGEGPFGQREEIPEGLAPYGRLLSGRSEALHEAWISDPTILPPVQALAAALAMQEVLGGDGSVANWSLLDQLPCFTLPLRLMGPARATPDGRNPGEPVVVP